MEECMVALGGAGYMAENALGRLIQDALVEKIWEGTVAVLALDLVRAVSRAPAALDAFAAWAEEVLSSCPADLRSALAAPLTSLRAALRELASAYAAPLAPLVPRPALFLFSHIASGLFLLEHAVWACGAGEASAPTDVEVFVRWVDEGGLAAARDDVRRAQAADGERLRVNGDIVYGARCDPGSTGGGPARARL
ncbi:uncharacterized protein FIBRA_02682 [Fibroporia radiculosa]|uniref:Acyl-CoA oxidase C-alpha1 domain-containing protein n=1 Tax=Fibroporia radiculosa TaxID=599839 RepID=J4GN16_9APHY|nr:uncharacterized protein FIBRA_02682 [Fibroporia radiculosa]CCM00645.1 predicted protein [Fibroporia radiculosa]